MNSKLDIDNDRKAPLLDKTQVFIFTIDGLVPHQHHSTIHNAISNGVTVYTYLVGIRSDKNKYPDVKDIHIPHNYQDPDGYYKSLTPANAHYIFKNDLENI